MIAEMLNKVAFLIHNYVRISILMKSALIHECICVFMGIYKVYPNISDFVSHKIITLISMIQKIFQKKALYLRVRNSLFCSTSSK